MASLHELFFSNPAFPVHPIANADAHSFIYVNIACGAIHNLITPSGIQEKEQFILIKAQADLIQACQMFIALIQFNFAEWELI